jgi:plastocyanin
MEQVQRIVVEVTGTPSESLLADLETHRSELRRRAGFRGMSIARSSTAGGNTLLSVETRWRDNNSLADYTTQPPNVEGILRAHADETVADSLEVRRMEALAEEATEPAAPVYERLAFALFVPIGVLVFALLVIYGLSRIYLAMDPNVATPVAAVIAIGILGVCGFIAANPVMERWQVAGIVGVTAAVLLGGGIYAGVNGKHKAEVPESVKAATATAQAGASTPAAGGTQTAGGGLEISTPDDTRYDKDTLTAKAGTSVTITYTNKSGLLHNIHFFNGADATAPSLGATKLDSTSTPQTVTFTTPSAPGEYFFHCDAHPQQMTGHLVVS